MSISIIVSFLLLQSYYGGQLDFNYFIKALKIINKKSTTFVKMYDNMLSNSLCNFKLLSLLYFIFQLILLSPFTYAVIRCYLSFL